MKKFGAKISETKISTLCFYRPEDLPVAEYEYRSTVLRPWYT